MVRRLINRDTTPRIETLAGIIYKEPLGQMIQIGYIPEEGRDTETAISNNTLVIVSYSSYKRELSPEKSTSSWIMECLGTKSRCFGVAFLGNTDNNTTPHQTELMGALAGIVATHMIASIWTVLEVSV